MALGSLFLVLALAVLVALFIVMPLWETAGSDELVPRQEVQEHDHQKSALLAERDRLLNALLELDADNDLGKIPPGEYAPLREKLVREAAAVLRGLDELNLSQDRKMDPSALENVLIEDEELEELVRNRKKQLDAGLQRKPDEAPHLSPAVTAYQAYCTYCGNALMSGDKYCPACGKKIPA